MTPLKALALDAANEHFQTLLADPAFPDSERHETAMARHHVTRDRRFTENVIVAFDAAYERLEALLTSTEFPGVHRPATTVVLNLVTQAMEEE